MCCLKKKASGECVFLKNSRGETRYRGTVNKCEKMRVTDESWATIVKATKLLKLVLKETFLTFEKSKR